MLSCKNCVHAELKEDSGRYRCQVLKHYIHNLERCAKICPDFERKKSLSTKVEKK